MFKGIEMRWYTLASLLLLTGCATNSQHPPAGAPVTEDLISTDGLHFGWGDIHLGDTRLVVEKVVGKPLLVVPDGYPACGDFTSNIEYEGHSMSLQWSSDDPDKARVQSISIELPQDELRPQEQIARHIQGKYPGFKFLHGDEDSIELVMPDGQALLIKNHKEHFLLVTYGGCIDN